MRYVVVVTAVECPDNGPGEECGEPVAEAKYLWPCSTQEEVGEAVRRVRDGKNWAIFEVDGKGAFDRVSISFEKDGVTVKDVS